MAATSDSVYSQKSRLSRSENLARKGQVGNANRISVGKPLGKRPFGTQKNKSWE
jgi:hypothetical protein